MKIVPGTNKHFIKEDAFDDIKKMIELTDGLALGQVCSITGLDPFVIQNWVKRGYVARPINKKYYEKQVARILMINSLKNAMKIEEIGELMTIINGDVEDESDDLLSEATLYSLFTKVVYCLGNVDDIDKVIKDVLKKNKLKITKLYTVLEIMVHAYIAGEHKKLANKNLQVLKGN